MTSSLSAPLNSRAASYRTCEGTTGKRKPGAKRSDKPCVYVGMLNEIVCISAHSVPTDVKGQLLALLETLQTTHVKTHAKIAPDTLPGTLLDTYAKTTPDTRKALDALRTHLERAVCHGDNAARGLLQALLPLVAYAIPIDALQPETQALLPHIGSAPDLYLFILQAIGRTNSIEDRLVMLMRTCFLFFPPSRRIQKRTEWEVVHGKSLVVLLRACLPTLLSLYPQTGTKDVQFELRVLLFRRWHALLAGTHEQRVKFFTANSSLLRVCLIEYFYYYVLHVHPMPRAVISADKIALLARNASNIGQHLRMELNKDMDGLVRVADGGDIDVDELLAGIADRAQLMFDRSMRYSKTVLPGMRVTHAAKRDRVHVQRWRRAQLVQVMAACGPALNELPYTGEFVLFQAACRRLKIAHEHTLLLWDLFRHVRVHNLTTSIARHQLETLCTLYQPLSVQMHTQQHMLLCIFCAYFHLDGLFRFDCDARSHRCRK